MKTTLLDKQGVSLVELLVVFSIVGILAVALGFSYQGWRAKYQVEKQMRELHADLMQARADALERKRNYFAVIASTSYSVYEDTNPAPDGNGTLETASDRLALVRTVEPSKPLTGAATIEFNTRGLANVLGSICTINTFDADYDCIVVSQSRVNLGKLSSPGGPCNEANCLAK